MSNHKPPVSSELSRDLSLFHITMMGLGMMIGAGVFIGIGSSIATAGPGAPMLTFALNGVLALFTAMSYAELSSAIPRAGGAYNFARVGFGRGTSFIAGWMEWFASSVAGSLYAVVFSLYVLRFFSDDLANNPWAVKGVALLVAVFFIYINYRGASETGKVGAFMTLGQTLFLVVIGVVGVFVAAKNPERFDNFKPFLSKGWGKLLVTMGFTYVAFEGYEVIAQAGDETIDARRNVPKAMLYSVCIVTLTYVLVAVATIVAVEAVPAGAEEGSVWEWIGSFGAKGFGVAVEQLMPRYGKFLVPLAVVFASTSALNATIYSATRASYALGRDRMLPAFFSRIAQKRKTPWVALLFTGAVVVLVATALPTEDVGASASMMFLFLFLLVNLCVIRIRLNMGDELKYGFLMPLFPLFPILAIAFQALLAGHLLEVSWIAWAVAPGWVLAGVVIYHVYSKSRAVPTPDEVHVFEREEAPEGDGYRIMLAVANPENAITMARNTYKICEAKQGRIELLHMVPVPDTVPLSDAEKYMTRGREGIVEAMLYLAPLFPISSHIRYCRNIARGIVSAVREKRIHMLIMGWHGQASTDIFTLGSTIDPVIERAPCNIVVMKECGNKKFKRVLVPLAGGPNGALALETASILAEENAEIVAFSVANRRRPFDLDGFIKQQRGRLQMHVEQIRTKVVAHEDVVDAILEEAEAYDLVVLGCTREPLLYHVGRETLPDTIARRCSKPLVMVKAPGAIKSWLKRWI